MTDDVSSREESPRLHKLADEAPDDAKRARLLKLFVGVILVQVISLGLLWCLQARFGGS